MDKGDRKKNQRRIYSKLATSVLLGHDDCFWVSMDNCDKILSLLTMVTVFNFYDSYEHKPFWCLIAEKFFPDQEQLRIKNKLISFASLHVIAHMSN